MYTFTNFPAYYMFDVWYILFSYVVIRYILIYKCVSAYIHHASNIECSLVVSIDSMNMTHLKCLYIYTTHMCFLDFMWIASTGQSLETGFVLNFGF